MILGVSPDGEESHAAFKSKFSLPFPLLADPDRTAARAYDVWREKNMYGKKSMGIVRSTFVIDADGTVVKAMYGVKPDRPCREGARRAAVALGTGVRTRGRGDGGSRAAARRA